MMWMCILGEISNVGDSLTTVPCKMRGAAFPQGLRGAGMGGGAGRGLEINYHSPEAVDWLPGNDNMLDSPTNKLSSFDLHIINS